MADIPVLDVDPFDDAFLKDPYPFHETIREAGPVVRLERYRIYASSRHAEVTAGLTDWQTYCSGAGVGLEDFRRAKPWRPPSLILEADPPLHTRSRTALNRALSAKAMASLREEFRDAARDFATAARQAHLGRHRGHRGSLSALRLPRRSGLGRRGARESAALWRDGLQRLRAAQSPFRGIVSPRLRGRGLDHGAVPARGAFAGRHRRDDLVGRGPRRDQRGGGAFAGALRADGGPRHHHHRRRQWPLRFRRQPRRVDETPRKPRVCCAPASTRFCVSSRQCKPSSAPRRSRPNSAALRCPRTPKSCCSSPAPIAIHGDGRRPTASTSPAAPPATSPSAPASTCASDRCSRGSKPR